MVFARNLPGLLLVYSGLPGICVEMAGDAFLLSLDDFTCFSDLRGISWDSLACNAFHVFLCLVICVESSWSAVFSCTLCYLRGVAQGRTFMGLSTCETFLVFYVNLRGVEGTILYTF